jgi:hypothetical protein
MSDETNCEHTRFEDVGGEVCWCIDCGALNISPDGYYIHLLKPDAPKWIEPQHQKDPAAIGVSSFADEPDGGQPDIMQRHQRAIANLHQRVTTLERHNQKLMKLLGWAVGPTASILDGIKKILSEEFRGPSV